MTTALAILVGCCLGFGVGFGLAILIVVFLATEPKPSGEEEPW